MSSILIDTRTAGEILGVTTSSYRTTLALEQAGLVPANAVSPGKQKFYRRWRLDEVQEAAHKLALAKKEAEARALERRLEESEKVVKGNGKPSDDRNLHDFIAVLTKVHTELQALTEVKLQIAEIRREMHELHDLWMTP